MRKMIENLRYIRGFREFDRAYYLENNPDVKESGVNPFKHYMETGWREGRNPGAHFSSSFYLGVYEDVQQAQVNPLDHYVRFGKKEGRKAFPVVHVDVEEVKQVFDAKFYLANNPDVALNGVEPFQHFMTYGWHEGRDPRADFDCAHYRRSHEIENGLDPLTHYVAFGRGLGLETAQSGSRGISNGVFDDFRFFANPGPDYEELEEIEGLDLAAGADPVKAFTFYLPQFHAIPENDEWWGKGFTEWRNTARGMPRFKGHYQPRIPEQLGFYDLSDVEIMKKQVAMAKAGGIHGFCFYYYWFDGKRVLDLPLDNYLANSDIDFPFSILWANENWTRRWDGLDADILLEQAYKEEEEDNFMADLARHFKDPRYHCVDGRPMFYLYRPNLIPNAKKTIRRWRKKLAEQHDLNPFILMVQGFGDHDPNKFGLDGAIEFPPHKIGINVKEISNKVEIHDPDFSGHIHRYDEIVANSKAEAKPKYNLIRGVTPAWDNEARRQGQGSTVYHGSTPQKFGNWLSHMAEYARTNPFHGEKMVFINAWNEWAEGAYLEPDIHYGAAYLNAARKALTRSIRHEGPRKIILIGHDAYRHGAQMLLLHIAEYLTRRLGLEVAVVLLNGGPLLPEYQEIAQTHVLSDGGVNSQAVLARLKQQGYKKAIVNTTVSAQFLDAMKKHEIESIVLVHELPSLLRQYKLEGAVKTAAKKARKIVFPAKAVKDGFEEVLGASIENKAVMRPQGAYKMWQSDAQAVAEIRKEVCRNPDDKIVFNAGYADLRKGFDLFCSVARAMRKKRPDIHFVWLGDVNSDLQCWVSNYSGEGEKDSNLHVYSHRSNPVPFFEASDLFFLTSREDPFPTVVLEALQAGMPLVGFEGCGGSVDLIREYGKLVEMGNPLEAAEAIEELLDVDKGERKEQAEARRKLIETEFRFRDYVFDLNCLLHPGDVKVSVVVPNYNYMEHLRARLDSIYNQSYPIYETIVLDDCSTDDSVKLLKAYNATSGNEFELVLNEQNSGSGYKQWFKGAMLSKGDYIWIAEADDLATPDFLEEGIKLLEDTGAAFVFCDSKQIDENGKTLAESYSYYLDGLETKARKGKAVFKGEDFVRDHLSVKNIILNVSGVIWKKEALQTIMEANEHLFAEMNLALDWKIYVDAALKYGSVGYIHKAMNVHRRHSASVTHALKAEKHFNQIIQVQEHVAGQVRLNDKIEARRMAYRDEVADYLGLNDTNGA